MKFKIEGDTDSAQATSIIIDGEEAQCVRDVLFMQHANDAPYLAVEVFLKNAEGHFYLSGYSDAATKLTAFNAYASKNVQKAAQFIIDEARRPHPTHDDLKQHVIFEILKLKSVL